MSRPVRGGRAAGWRKFSVGARHDASRPKTRATRSAEVVDGQVLAPGEVEDAGLGEAHDPLQPVGHVGRVRRRPPLVDDDGRLLAAREAVEEPEDDVRAARGGSGVLPTALAIAGGGARHPEDEGGAGDGPAVEAGAAGVVLGGVLAACVAAQRRRTRGLGVERAREAVEDEVGRDLHEARAGAAAVVGEGLDGVAVDLPAARRVEFAGVDVGHRGAVDDGRRREVEHQAAHGIGVGDVERGVAAGNVSVGRAGAAKAGRSGAGGEHVVLPEGAEPGHEFAPDEAVGSGDENALGQHRQEGNREGKRTRAAPETRGNRTGKVQRPENRPPEVGWWVCGW